MLKKLGFEAADVAMGAGATTVAAGAALGAKDAKEYIKAKQTQQKAYAAGKKVLSKK